MRKREAQFFYDDFSICPPPRAAPAARPRQAWKVNRLLRTLKLDSDFFSNLIILRARFRCMTSFTSPPLILSIWDFYFDISELGALMLHLTNPCAERKVLSLTKPKGKIYKTKSLRNNITRGIRQMQFSFWIVNCSQILS